MKYEIEISGAEDHREVASLLQQAAWRILTRDPSPGDTGTVSGRQAILVWHRESERMESHHG